MMVVAVEAGNLLTLLSSSVYGFLARYAKLRVARPPGMPGTFSPPPMVSMTNSIDMPQMCMQSLAYPLSVYSYQSRVLTNLNWVHFDRKCCADRSRWDENGSAARQCQEWYISSDFYRYSSQSVKPVLPDTPWNVGCDLLKFVCGTKMSKRESKLTYLSYTKSCL